MKPFAFVSLTLLAGVLLAASSQAESPPRAHPAQTFLTAAQLTGSYEAGKRGTLDVQALPGGKVRFHLIALAFLHAPGGAHIGEAEGTLPLRHNVAVYTDKEEGGRMILRFAPRRVYVSQAGDLEFGAGVVAEGVYKKTSSRTPKFDPEDH